MKICIVISSFYPKISKMLLDGAVKKLKKNNIYKFHIFNVPGTFEIPVTISNLIKKYDAFIVLGCVIKGQTSHFHYLCSSVINSLVNLSVQTKKPIGNGILTCNNKKQAIIRANPKKKNKGGEAAQAVISLLNKIK
tara:strand:- start:148 stop:555 length:408 start_codon:yes stop_codon:yes gene_type:complete